MGGDDLMALIEEAHGWRSDRPRLSEADRKELEAEEIDWESGAGTAMFIAAALKEDPDALG